MTAKLLEGAVVAITGAGGGLGRAYALYCAKLGAKLVINDVGSARDGEGTDSSFAEKVAGEVRNLGAEAVANTESVSSFEGAKSIVSSAVNAFGRLDVLINNAGILRDKTILKMDEAQWDAVIAVHLKGTFLCSQAAAAQMKEQGSGSIINTTSYAGMKGNYGQANYAAAKAGIYAFTRVAALELERFGIRVNAIAPLAKTRMTEDIDVIPESMTPEHVAPMVAFLASDLSSAVNGRVFGVHGDHLFEYKVDMTDGRRGEAWSPSAIDQNIEEISGKVQTTAGEAAASISTSGSSGADQDKVASIFAHMPEGFMPDKAGDWNAILHWQIAGAGDYTVRVENGSCSTSAALEGKASCVVATDAETFLGIIDGSVDGQQAYMKGKITASKIGDLMKYQKAIDARKALKAAEASLQKAAQSSAQESSGTQTNPNQAEPQQPEKPHPGKKIWEQLSANDRLKLLLCLSDGRQVESDDSSTIYVTASSKRYTVVLANKRCSVSLGHSGQATSQVIGEAESLVNYWLGNDVTVDITAAKLTITNVSQLRTLRSALAEKPLDVLYDVLESRGEGMNTEALGTSYHGEPFVIDEEEIAAFAKATIDENPSYFASEQTGRGLAPPLFPVRYFNPVFEKILTEPSMRVNLSQLLFGEMELTLYDRLTPGDIVAAKAKPTKVSAKDTGEVLSVEAKLVSEGRVKATAVARFFVRWPKAFATLTKKLSEPKKANQHSQDGTSADKSSATFSWSIETNGDQPPLFAKAANDPNPIHLDEQFAKSVGLPGVILHGLCTMAMCAQSFVEKAAQGKPTGLKSISVRFAKPAFPGDRVTVYGFLKNEDTDGQHYTFFATNQSGENLITNGEATVSNA